MRGLALPRELGVGAVSGIAEVVDLVDDAEPIDVDSYIMDVLIVQIVNDEALIAWLQVTPGGPVGKSSSWHNWPQRWS